uniref:C-CAP/cofactor C-like domain-containing protein n=1 Tax=Meloidogyne enterolobii TaxID=390850 RepID=A0A6V7UL88_MELEN|nr:unnamed protein product [Meloidogyne enterolobii]
MTTSATESKSYPIDDCFGKSIGRENLDKLTSLNLNEDSGGDGEMITFVEFIRGQKKKKIDGILRNEAFENLRPIDEDDPSDNFFDVALDTARVPEDPVSTFAEGRSKSYMVNLAENEAASFGQSLCLTVGEHTRWLGVPRRDSQESAAYGCETLGEKEVKNETTNATMQDTPQHQEEKQQEDGRLMVFKRSGASTTILFSRIFCCLRRAVDVNNNFGLKEKRCEVFINDNNENKEQTNQHSKLYSWDIREEQQKDPKDFLWQGLVGETRVKEPGQLAGNPFQIESCLNCTLVILDQTASITIDDCRDCLIICGPCKGSLFLRDCKNLLILAICQQFRTRDCRHLNAHLFCTTCPTIEETDLEVAPLLLNYCGLQSQMHAAGISPFSNRWNQVHNFTPDSGKCNVRQNLNPKITNSFNSHLIQKLEHFLFNSKNWQFSMGNKRESKLFVAGLGIKKGGGEGQNGEEEKFLLLIQPPPNENSSESGGGMRFYAESIGITKELINLEGIKLAAMHDIDMKQGEWENIICGKKENNNLKNIIGNKSRKIVALEIYGPKGSQTKIEEICQQKERKATNARLVDSEHMENCRKQLYRLCEIRQSI